MILIFLSLACWWIGEASEKPNFVFILADDCTYLDMEVYGGPSKTPHILQLAEEGMTFTRCYQSASMCSPTRHALYTGIHPIRNGAYPNHARAYENVRSVPHFLSRENYRVVLAGKRHVEPESVFPFEYLDEFADPSDREVRKVNGWRYPKVLQVMRDSVSANRPFCLFLCSNEPHGPY
ncbi:MAG: sulfatase-like hydrolase/transferase, partial [Verrucomicrobiota bacterium]|nr:sulfatase-like hydrolase/transferase [Verrucomicrobiota bacterium]